MAKNITPVFTSNADLQAALTKQYVAEQAAIKQILDAEKIPAIGELRGLKGQGFQFAVGHLSFGPEEQAQENGYRRPIGALTITLKTKGQQEQLTLSAKQDGEVTIASAADSKSTSNLARVQHMIEGWRIDMEEKYGFDATMLVKQLQFERTDISPGGPRPEKK